MLNNLASRQPFRFTDIDGILSDLDDDNDERSFKIADTIDIDDVDIVMTSCEPTAKLEPDYAKTEEVKDSGTSDLPMLDSGLSGWLLFHKIFVFCKVVAN